MPAESHRTTSHAGTQCLLLAPRGRPAPAELLEGLRQRGVDVCEVNDPPAVMVALARRTIATIVIVEPALWARLPDLMGAIRKYHPAAALWQYAADAQPRLSHCSSSNAAAAAPRLDRAQPGRAAAAAAPPKLPVADVRPLSRDLLTHDELRLTEEEIAMLLGDDDDAGAPGGPS